MKSSEKIADDRAILAPSAKVRGSAADFSQEIILGNHHLQADEPVGSGGYDAGPSPYELLLAGLGACTSMTVGMYDVTQPEFQLPRPRPGIPPTIFSIGGPVIRIRINQPRISHLNFSNFLTGTKPYPSRN
jgi:hypothetical protein